MLSYFFKKILTCYTSFTSCCKLTFFLVRLAPGGPFDADKAVHHKLLKILMKLINLDAPVWEQYVDYMSGIL